MFNNPVAVSPSIATLYYSIYYFLVNHPLLNSGLVKHTLTQEIVEISEYRLFGGFPLTDGLVCSIYPLFDEANLSSPATINASVIYNTYNLGSGNEDEAKYHFVIDYSYRGVNLDNQLIDANLTKVPKDHIIIPKDVGVKSKSTKEINLYINPYLDVICQYLELTRLALVDTQHTWRFPFGETHRGTLSKVEPIHINLPTVNWQKSTNVIDTRGYLLIRMNGYMSRDWRKMWDVPLESVSITGNLIN